MADEEGRDDGGGLDGDPHHAEIAAHHGQTHRGEEGVHEDVVVARCTGRGPVRGAFARQVRGRRAARDERDGADDEQHPHSQGIGTQQPGVRGQRPLVQDTHGQQAPAQHDRHGGDDAGPSSRKRLRGRLGFGFLVEQDRCLCAHRVWRTRKQRGRAGRSGTGQRIRGGDEQRYRGGGGQQQRGAS
ncbi:hypothetical protein [Streptomyces sp. IMTB 2501]|uniref:hypothetical protein n=1 Tax=Streptomyces sp. IMTB 2501 TaxID=1776340 RepID=UPI002117244F|nr:hypothetical protein [Streptomyces sp. IMTB 2501]